MQPYSNHSQPDTTFTFYISKYCSYFTGNKFITNFAMRSIAVIQRRLMLLGTLAFLSIHIVYGQKHSLNSSDDKQKQHTVTLNNDTAFAQASFSETPFLTGYYYVSKDKKLDDFNSVVEEIGRRKSMQYVGEEGSQPATFAFPTFPANVHLALFFRNWPIRAMQNENQLFEYKLVDVADKNADTSIPWTQSGDVVVIPTLNSGKDYMLMIRYTGNNDRVSVYFFKTDSIWRPYWKYFKKKLPYFLVLFLIVDIFLLWRFLNTKRRNRQYQLELKSLFAQLNPHFLFNSLSSIQGLINSDEIEKANQYLSGFSGLLRTTLDKGGKELILLSEEMENLENYIHFEQLRFNFRYEKDIEPDLPLTEINMLPLLTQPLIENSVKHGISGMGENGILSIRIYSVGRDLLVAVKDNGKGFDVDNYKAGYGVDLVLKRIAAYNKWHRKTKIHLTMKSIPSNTVIVLQFQNWLPK
ncbi:MULTISPECIES: sensor histidine kinase [Chitinophagaceae]